MKVLVVGATGNLGSAICNRLQQRGHSVRAITRPSSDAAKVSALKASTAEVATADLTDAGSLDLACRGADAVVSSATAIMRGGGDTLASVDLEGQRNLIEAAKAARARHFTFVSFTGNIPKGFPLCDAKRDVEEYLKQSGLVYTILRPSFFQEFWIGPGVGFDYANGKVTIYGDGKPGISFIASSDVVEFAARSIDETGMRNAVIELGGPQALSPNEIVKIFEDATHRKFEVQYVSKDALLEQRAAATDPVKQTLTGLFLAYAAGDPIDMSETLKRFPIHLQSVQEYAESVASTATPA